MHRAGHKFSCRLREKGFTSNLTTQIGFQMYVEILVNVTLVYFGIEKFKERLAIVYQ